MCDSPNRSGIIGTSLDESKCRARPLAPPAAGIPPGAFGPWEGSTQGANGGRYPSRPAHEARHAGRGAPGLRGRGRKLCSRGSGARPQGSELCAQGKKPCTRPQKGLRTRLRSFARKVKSLARAPKRFVHKAPELCAQSKKPCTRPKKPCAQGSGAARKGKRLAHGPKSLAAKAPGLAREVPEPDCRAKSPAREAPRLGREARRAGAEAEGLEAGARGLGREAWRPGEPDRRKAGDAARPPAPLSPARPRRRDPLQRPLKFLPFTLRSLPKDSDDGAVEQRLRACVSAPTLGFSVPCFAAVLDSTRACTS